MDKLIKDRDFIDNIYKTNCGILNIDRLYKVNESAFKDETYDELARIYRMLPEFVFNPVRLCSWFGDEDKGDTYYLNVSFEKGGLRLIGKLPENNFKKWEEQFHEHIVRIPFRKR